MSSLSDPGAFPYSPVDELAPLSDRVLLSKPPVLPVPLSDLDRSTPPFELPMLPERPFPIGSGKLLS